jgi:hypothetical protein
LAGKNEKGNNRHSSGKKRDYCAFFPNFRLGFEIVLGHGFLPN